MRHNHITRDVKPLGKCPACDEYHNRNIPQATVQPDTKRDVGTAELDVFTLMKQVGELSAELEQARAELSECKWANMDKLAQELNLKLKADRDLYAQTVAALAEALKSLTETGMLDIDAIMEALTQHAATIEKVRK